MMFCTMYRWLISRSMDSPEGLGRRTARHVEHCETCRSYRDSCVSLGDRLAGAAEALSGAVSEILHAKILLRCGIGAAAAPLPAKHVPRRGAGRLKLVLAITAAAAAILIGAALWQALPTTTEKIVDNDPPTPHVPPGGVPPEHQLVRGLMGSPRIAAAFASQVNSVVDRSLDRELDQVREGGRAAADFVLARMPITINIPE